ncbi:MAG: efflux RND transporter periplasmic adaptor subunit, partial [Verrucomicrobiota bacterium]
RPPLTTPLLPILIMAGQAPRLPSQDATLSDDSIDSTRAANTIILDAEGTKNLGIETVTVAETDFEESFFAIGRIEHILDKHAVLSSRIPGRIVELEAHTGDSVSKGDVLARVESRQPGSPPPVIELMSPISGIITESHVHLGEPVEPDLELLDIVDLSKVWAVARVPENLAAKLEPGATLAHIRIPALGEESLEGTLLRFGTSADRESGTIDAYFEIPNPNNRIRPGMRAEFSVVTEVRTNVMAVPRSAIQGDPSGRIVYVTDFELPNAFVRAPVVLGSQNDRFAEIKSGLFPGDEVVTTGSYLLGFAGGGGISLKEALDAAHGHEHNEDGSEMTAAQRAAAKAAKKAAANPGRSSSAGPLTFFLATTSTLLLILLILSLTLHKKHTSQSPTKP